MAVTRQAAKRTAKPNFTTRNAPQVTIGPEHDPLGRTDRDQYTRSSTALVRLPVVAIVARQRASAHPSTAVGAGTNVQVVVRVASAGPSPTIGTVGARRYIQTVDKGLAVGFHVRPKTDRPLGNAPASPLALGTIEKVSKPARPGAKPKRGGGKGVVWG